MLMMLRVSSCRRHKLDGVSPWGSVEERNSCAIKINNLCRQWYLQMCSLDPHVYPHRANWDTYSFSEHEGPVSLVSVSSDSLQVLAATSTGNLGYLDVTSRGYNTLMRSHTDTVLGFSVDGIRRHLTTASSDGTVRIWNMDSLDQVS